MGLVFDSNIAKVYESWSHSPQGRAIEKYLEQLLVTLLDPKPGERVLDIGCGTGNHLLILSKLGLDVSGLDASPYMLNKARERLGHRSCLRMGIAEDLPFDDNEFDLVVLINTLEFLDDPIRAFSEAGRVANRKVFVGVINSLSWHGLLKRTQGYLGDPLFGKAKFYNLWQVKSLLQMVYGYVPISWACTKKRPSFVEEISPFANEFWSRQHYPFGCFLGISATMVYQVRTDNIPLKIRLKKAGQSLVGAKTLEDLKLSKGVHEDERGLSL